MTIMCKVFGFRLNYILRGNPISEEKGRRTMIWKTMTCYIC